MAAGRISWAGRYVASWRGLDWRWRCRASAAEDWVYARTANFEVLSSTSEREAEALVGRLELFRENFIDVLPGPPFHQTRITLVLFNRDKSFGPYRPLIDGREQPHLKCIVHAHADEVVIGLCADGSIRERSAILYHNYVSLLSRWRGYNLPPWLDAGLSAFYETIEIEEASVTVGRRHKGHVELLNGSPWIMLPEMLAVNRDSPEYSRVRFHAQSWALVHFLLMTSPEETRWRDLNRLIAVLQRGVTSRNALQEVYGKPVEQIGNEVLRYVRETGKYAVQIFPKKAGTAKRPVVPFRRATESERDLALANLRWRSRKGGDEAYRVFQVAETNPDSPRAFEVLGSIAIGEGERRQAEAHWREAFKRGTDNPILPVWLAKESLRQSLIEVSPGFRLPEGDAVELRGWLDRAIMIDENYVEAWDWLALTEAFSVKIRAEVIRDLQAKREAWGSRPRVLAALALIALRAGNADVAEALADAVLMDPMLGWRPSGEAAMRMALAESRGVGGLWTPIMDKGSEVLDLARAVKLSAQEEKARAHNRARAK
jgi:hypothetical protein